MGRTKAHHLPPPTRHGHRRSSCGLTHGCSCYRTNARSAKNGESQWLPDRGKAPICSGHHHHCYSSRYHYWQMAVLAPALGGGYAWEWAVGPIWCGHAGAAMALSRRLFGWLRRASSSVAVVGVVAAAAEAVVFGCVWGKQVGPVEGLAVAEQSSARGGLVQWDCVGAMFACQVEGISGRHEWMVVAFGRKVPCRM